MKHRMSEFEIARHTRPFFPGGRFWGVAIAAGLAVPYMLWQMPRWEFRDVFVFATYLALAGLVGLVVVMARRLLRPSRKQLEETLLEIDRHGVWKEAGRTRSLLVGVRQVQSVDVYRDHLNLIQRVVIGGAGREVSVDGLADMEALLSDAVGSFPHAKVNAHKP